MKSYFQLQAKMLHRHFTDFGISPIVAYVLLIIGFVYGSNALFSKVEFAAYLYCFITLATVIKLSAKERNDFIKLCFSIKSYKQIRILENVLLTAPFIFFLFYQQAYIFALVLFISALALSLVKVTVNTNFTIPTPFGKSPFEFTEGFRKTFVVFPVAYALTIIGIKVANFNLAAFSLLLIFATCISFFQKPEPSYYVWLFKKSPKEFLYYKIKKAFINVTWLSIPILVIVTCYFPSKIIVLIAIQLIGYVYLAQFILAKYAVFPNQMSLPTVIIFVVSVSFPPFVLVTFWYFYKEALKKTNTVLHD